MINAYNLTEQTLSTGDYVTFNGYNFGGNKFCSGDQNSLTVTRTGTYEIQVVVNATPTVAGQMQFNITRNGSNIPGGFIYLPGVATTTTENGSAKVIVNAFAGTTFGLRNNTETNDVVLPEQATTITIKRVA